MAGRFEDPITAQGISDAFRDAELCATGLDRTLTADQISPDKRGSRADSHPQTP